MSWIELMVLALALSLDSLAVSVATGTTTAPNVLKKNAFIFGISFGMAHALALYLGWIAGEKFIAQISEVDHWIAFGLLVIIGGKMIFESFFGEKKQKSISLNRLPILCIATSIDALGIGLSLSLINESIIRAASVIGIIVCLISIFGVLCGRELKKYIGHYAEIIGGIVLIGIGIKILIEHL